MDKKMVGGCDEVHAGSRPGQEAVRVGSAQAARSSEELLRYGADMPS
jgi:hypothetical protein